MPGQPVILDTMGGLVATARPEDIPEGTSPRTYDTDFIVGKVIQRPGLKSMYAYSSASGFGPLGGGVAANFFTTGNTWINPNNVLADDGTFTTSAVVSPLNTDALHITNFNFTIPSTIIPFGILVEIKGFAPAATLDVQLIKNGIPIFSGRSITLPQTNGVVPIGGQNDLWGNAWIFSDFDNTGFGVLLNGLGSIPQTIAIDYVSVTIFGVDTNVNFNGLTDVNLNQTDQTTLALDSDGITWAEDVINAPNILSLESLIPPVVPGSYLKGIDANGIAYMAYSDLTQGTSQPMQWNGKWCDRITQVGPGQAPVFTPIQSSSDTFAISTITQNPPNSDITDPGHLSVLLQSSGPGSTSPGNVITVYYSPSFYGGAFHPEAEDLILDNAFNAGIPVYVYISGAPFGNGTYLVTSVGDAQPPGVDHGRFYFTVQVPTVAYQNVVEATGQYQMSVATLTTSVPVPGLTVGNQITITGASVAAYDALWPISQTLNSSTMEIDSTQVTASVATYAYSLTGGSLVAPSTGQLVTITGTSGANGALNGANLTITSASGGTSGTFTVAVPVTTAPFTLEHGQATTEGTMFAFEPGLTTLGGSSSPIFGNSTGGSLTFTGATAQLITAGIKQGSVFFITRNGAVTRPANPVTFTVPINTTAIQTTLIPIGPPNVIARGITFTESGQNGVAGANFYTYDTPVSFTVNGIDYTASALIIPDNVTTSATFTFPDSVLLASDEIDVQGNNYFNLIEIGSPAWIFQYASRVMYGLCQTKVQNFINLSFDGGYLPATNLIPLGWSVVPIHTPQVGLVPSPDFGNSLEILNVTPDLITDAIAFYQPAYQDFYGVNILQPNTGYSVRLKARALNADGQLLTIGLRPFSSGIFSPLIGSVTFRLNQGAFTIQTAEILVATSVIPPTLQLTIEVASLAAAAGIQIDRIEVFPTSHPVDTTTIWTSYAGQGGGLNAEAIDGVTGQLGCGDDNPQPAQGAYQILENLYIEKTNSCCVTQDSPNYEPNQWKVPLSSQGSGSVGPNAFHSEEEFSIKASRSGIFLFDGGKPMPISRELQSTGVIGSLWETINWNLAKTIWCRYSTTKRQLYVGVPMNIPNFWIPNVPAFQPPLTGPNVILMCNFTGVPTAEEFAAALPVHTTIFGDLKALDMRRKWSIWQIQSPVAEFVTRGDGVSAPLFLGNGIKSSKIYELVNGSALQSGQNTDDGMPINWLYTTYGFVKAKQGQQTALGALRKVWYYFAATMEGIGQVARKFYSNSLGAKPQNIYTAPPATLSYPQQNDQEAVLEIGGQRLFVEFSSIGTGGYAEIGQVMLDGELDKNAPHRGVSA